MQMLTFSFTSVIVDLVILDLKFLTVILYQWWINSFKPYSKYSYFLSQFKHLKQCGFQVQNNWNC